MTPSQRIDQLIAKIPDWRGKTFSALRKAILAADKGITEDWKWDVPVWTSSGIITTGEVYKKAVKLTFAKGAALPDPAGLFNSSLTGNVRRAIDFAEGAAVNEAGLAALVRAAIALNAA